MNFNKTFLTLGLAATLLQMPTSSVAQNAGGNRQNPLLVKSSLPFGAPDFSKIQESDYICIVTRGHRHDADCLRMIGKGKEPAYLGMIGSRRRVGIVKQELLEEGYDPERMSRFLKDAPDRFKESAV